MLSTGILEICKKIDQMLMAVVSLNGGIIGGVLFFFYVVQVSIMIMYYYRIIGSFILNKSR